MGCVVETFCGNAGDLTFDVFFEFDELLARLGIVEAVETSAGAITRLSDVVIREFREVVVDDVFDA